MPLYFLPCQLMKHRMTVYDIFLYTHTRGAHGTDICFPKFSLVEGVLLYTRIISMFTTMLSQLWQNGQMVTTKETMNCTACLF